MPNSPIKKKEANPGSKEAIALGCKCPVIDNHYGKGVLNNFFWISKDCELHANK